MRARISRRRVAAAALAAGLVVGGGVPAAAEPTVTFAGQCTFQATTTSSGALSGSSVVTGSGTCTGSLLGGSWRTIPVTMQARQTGLSLGPIPALTSGEVTTTFRSPRCGTTCPTLRMHIDQVGLAFVVNGAAGGSGIGTVVPSSSGATIEVQTVSTLAS